MRAFQMAMADAGSASGSATATAMTGTGTDGPGVCETRPARVLVGEIASAHGIRGAVKVRSHTADPLAIAGYGPIWTSEAGTEQLRLRITGRQKTLVLAEIDGVRDRTTADALRGTRLYVDRSNLPPPGEEEFYHADLIGLSAVHPDGRSFGMVTAIYDFGGGDVLEIRLDDGQLVHLPFTRAIVPIVDVNRRLIVVEPPENLTEPPEQPRPTEGDGP